MKTLNLLFGLQAGKPSFYCHHCCSNEKGTFGEFNKNEVWQERYDLLESNGFSKERAALFQSIQHTNYQLPWLHIWIGIGGDVVDLVRKEALKIDLKIYDGKNNFKEFNFLEDQLKSKVKNSFKHNDVKKQQDKIEELEDQLKTHTTILGEIQDMIKIIMEDSELEEELPEVCQHVEGCLVDLLKIFLPGRLDQRDWIRCGNASCRKW